MTSAMRMGQPLFVAIERRCNGFKAIRDCVPELYEFPERRFGDEPSTLCRVLVRGEERLGPETDY